VLFLSCVWVSVSGVMFSVGVCVCDLLIFLTGVSAAVYLVSQPSPSPVWPRLSPRRQRASPPTPRTSPRAIRTVARPPYAHVCASHGSSAQTACCCPTRGGRPASKKVHCNTIYMYILYVDLYIDREGGGGGEEGSKIGSRGYPEQRGAGKKK